ncbi:MAG: hypothetical protein FJW38_29235 [Acidobacteria bacterium]|nr:hypothetical protein [Acidobacteriota bacterium]
MRIIFLLLASLALNAQIPEDPSIYERLRDFLQLTPEQCTKTKGNNAAYGDWVLEKLKRMKTVQDEIAIESKRETIVPGALGARYAEIEVIGRELLARRAALAVENRKVLKDALLEKFKVFDEVLKLQPVIGTLRGVNLLEGEEPCFVYFVPTSGGQGHFCSGSTAYVNLP